jgi:hypothetical protein
MESSYCFVDADKNAQANILSNPFGNPMPFGTAPGTQAQAPWTNKPGNIEAALWQGTGETDMRLVYHRIPDTSRMARWALPMPVPKDPGAWVYPDYAGARMYPSN